MKNMWRENVPMITRLLICGVSITVDFNRAMDISVIQWQIAPDYHIIVTYNNMTVIHVWGCRTCGWELGQFNYPSAVASDRDLIYVADTHNNRIQVLNVTNTDYIEVIRVIANDLSVLYKPHGISVDPVSGDIFVTSRRSDDGSWIYIITCNMTSHYVRHLTPSDLGVDRTRPVSYSSIQGPDICH